jgi:outer membrane biosynthesis protein TonB
VNLQLTIQSDNASEMAQILHAIGSISSISATVAPTAKAPQAEPAKTEKPKKQSKVEDAEVISEQKAEAPTRQEEAPAEDNKSEKPTLDLAKMYEDCRALIAAHAKTHRDAIRAKFDQLSIAKLPEIADDAEKLPIVHAFLTSIS